MRTNLWDDPRVASLCDALSCDEARVCGGLFRLWSLADTHSTDGRLQYSAAALNRKVGIDGFAEAMQAVGWLASVDGLMTLPRFDEHNGRSAKRRAQEAMRSAKHYRRQSEGEPLTQVSRSERENSVIKSKSKSKNNKSKKQNQNEDVEAAGRSPPPLSDDFSKPQRTNRIPFRKPTTPEVTAYVLEIGAIVDARQFVDFYESNGWQVGRNAMKDWKATVRNWESRRLKGKHYDNHYNATRAARGNNATVREDGNQDSITAVYGAEAVAEDCVGVSALVFDEENAGTDSASTRHLG